MSEPERKGKSKSDVRGRIPADIVFFDNDGTLFDSRIGVISAVQDAYREFCQRHGLGFPVPTAERILELTGHPSGYFYPAILPEGYKQHAEELQELSLVHEKRAIAKEGRLFEGAAEVLSELRKRGKKLVLMTHAGGDYAGAIVEKFRYRDRFDLILHAGDGGFPSKVEMVSYAMKTLGASHADGVIVVGDKLADMEAAKHHGAVAVLAGYGFGGGEERELADFVIEELGELLGIIE